MAVFAILRHILSLYSNQKTTCASSISAVRENRSPRNHQIFLADTNNLTLKKDGKYINPAILLNLIKQTSMSNMFAENTANPET